MASARLAGLSIAVAGLGQLTVWVFRLEPFAPLGYVVGLGGFLLFSLGAELTLGETTDRVSGSRWGVAVLLVYALACVIATTLVFYPDVLPT